MHLQQHLQAYAMGRGKQVGVLSASEVGGNEQHGIGTHHLGFIELIGVDDELLAQNGEVGHEVPHAANEIDVTAEVLLVGEDAHGTGPTGGILRHDVFGHRISMNPSLAGTLALELCDDATGTCSQTLLHASPLGKGLLQFNALVADNFLKYILHGFLSLYIKVGSIY